MIHLDGIIYNINYQKHYLYIELLYIKVTQKNIKLIKKGRSYKHSKTVAYLFLSKLEFRMKSLWQERTITSLLKILPVSVIRNFMFSYFAYFILHFTVRVVKIVNVKW